MSYDISLSDLLHSVWHPLGPSMLLQMTLFLQSHSWAYKQRKKMIRKDTCPSVCCSTVCNIQDVEARACAICCLPLHALTSLPFQPEQEKVRIIQSKNNQQDGCKFFFFFFAWIHALKKEKLRINKLQWESCCPITSVISYFSGNLTMRLKDFKI